MGERRAAVKTPLDPTEVKAALRRAWLLRFGDEPTSDSIAVLMAQVSLETGLTSCIAWNLGNAKAHPGGDVDWCFFQTWEAVPSAIAQRNAAADPEHVTIVSDDGTHAKVVFKPDHPATCFRAFGSLDEGVSSYFRMMTQRFAAAWPAVRAGAPRTFAVLLKAAGYYTAPVEEYARGLEARFEVYAEPPLGTTSDIAAALATLGYATVRDFQAAKMGPADVDGVVGPLTKRAIRAALRAA